ncbi:hypothetical protein AVEN_48796-1 [Araneus ventricosus]|uniref:Uncharacterized protein n=1 Tax=Araneus ventricosus TaxID=182803 RepID=A0A4Y2IGB9_ARAVE|nr:hypothetical protein AVEN_48796-1 [Araneus ventricosus]
MCRRVASDSVVQSESSKVTMVLCSSTECPYAAWPEGGGPSFNLSFLQEGNLPFILELRKPRHSRALYATQILPLHTETDRQGENLEIWSSAKKSEKRGLEIGVTGSGWMCIVWRSHEWPA